MRGARGRRLPGRGLAAAPASDPQLAAARAQRMHRAHAAGRAWMSLEEILEGQVTANDAHLNTKRNPSNRRPEFSLLINRQIVLICIEMRHRADRACLSHSPRLKKRESRYLAIALREASRDC